MEAPVKCPHCGQCPSPEEKDTAWLIEMPAARWGAGYFWIGLVEYRTWGSVEEAVRFSRKDDAERVIASLHQQDERRYGYKQELKYEACEHQWPSSPQKPRDPNALKNRKQPCTCTGSCRGPEGLGEGWVCGLTLPQ